MDCTFPPGCSAWEGFYAVTPEDRDYFQIKSLQDLDVGRFCGSEDSVIVEIDEKDVLLRSVKKQLANQQRALSVNKPG